MENSLAVPNKFKCTPILGSNNHTLRYLTKKKKEILKKVLNKNVHNSFSYNQQKLEKTHLPINWRINKRSWYIYTMEYYSPIHKNKQQLLIQTTAWMNLKNHEQKKPVHSAWFHLLKFKNDSSLDDTNQSSGCPRGMEINWMGITLVIIEFLGGSGNVLCLDRCIHWTKPRCIPCLKSVWEKKKRRIRSIL